jgi:hypothetical protein
MTFISERSGRFAVALLLRVLDIAESTYYAWKKQVDDPADRDLVDLGLLSNIYEIWEPPASPTARIGCTGSCAATGSGWAVNVSSG